MTHRQDAPHPILQDYIKCLWISERHFQPPHHIFEILPDSYIELIFTFGAPCYVDIGGTLRVLPRCAVVGLFDKPLRLCAEGTVQTIAARFFAWGFFPLFQTDVQHLPNSIHPLTAPWHTLADQMAQAVEAGNLDVALDTLHAYLLNHVLTHQFQPQEIQEAARQIADQHGQVSIMALADQCHYSHRQLERKFNRAVGMTPKALARKIRFERVRDHLTRDPQVNLAALAHDYGYADQAHLARDFKHYSEKTLTEFAREMAALRRWMRETYDVVFLQDPPRSS